MKIDLFVVAEYPEDWQDFLMQLEQTDVQFIYCPLKKSRWLEEMVEHAESSEKENIVLICLSENSRLLSLVKQVRESVRVPVFVLSDRESYYQELQCLQRGADDYQSILRPVPILWERIYRLIQLYHGRTAGQLVQNGLTEQMESCQFYYGERSLRLTGKEYQVLHWLMHSREKMVSRQKLLYHVWGENNQTGSRALDTIMKQLRQKLKGTTVSIKTCYGKGYQLVITDTVSDEQDDRNCNV